MAEVPSLNHVAKKYQKQGVTLVAVHAPSWDKARIEEAMKRYKVSYPVALDRELQRFVGETQSLYGVRSLPTKVVIDPKGVVRCITPNLTDAVDKIEELLRERMDH